MAPSGSGRVEPWERVFPLQYGHQEGALKCQPAKIAKTMEKMGQASRPISTGSLNPLQGVHTRPINLVVFQGS